MINAMDENNEKPLLGADNNALVALLAVNLVSYVILGLIKVIYYLESLSFEKYTEQIFNPLTLTQNWTSTPWSLFTYNWIHDGFWVIFGNLIWLSVFGYTMQMKGANKHIFPIYFYGGIVGAIAFLLIGSNQPLLGAGVSVTAIIIASMVLIPNYKFLSNMAGGISLWMIGVAYLLIQAYFLLDANIAIEIATLFGGITGLVYVMFLKKGKDLGKWMHQLLNFLNNSLAPKN
jgi:membrane associated rhomboid family serine protease